MRKKFSRERLRYWLDCLMSRGPITMSLLLLAITVTIVGVIGVLAFFVSDEGGILYQLWVSLMHTLDAGALAGDAIDNGPYLILMSLATLCGMFITSILIGIVTAGVESKIKDLSKGTSVVQEQGHTTIIGFNENIFSLLSEMIEANTNKKDTCIVILGDQSKESMEDAISANIPDTRTTRIICRSGRLNEQYSLNRCAVECSRSVIINIHDDAETVKTLLALSTYVKDKTLVYPELRFVASLQDSQYIEAAKIAGEGRAEVIYTKDAIARIIANTCRQHGLSHVLSELFNFRGNELYFETIPEMTGKSIQEALLSFSNAVPVGLYTNGEVRLNPPVSTVIAENDKLILLEEDDGAFKCHSPKQGEESQICGINKCLTATCNHLVVLGSNDKLPIILTEYDRYVFPGTRVVIVDDDVREETLTGYNNLVITKCDRPVTRALLRELLQEDVNNVLLLNDDSESAEASDSKTLLRLILLRDLADKMERHFAITTEMRNTDNQRLASQARVDDFVIGTNFACLLMAQISENPMMAAAIRELLDESGSELYMKPAVNYVPMNQPVDSYTLTESAALRGEVYLGYRHVRGIQKTVVVNPPKDEKLVFHEGDQIVVIAEN